MWRMANDGQLMGQDWRYAIVGNPRNPVTVGTAYGVTGVTEDGGDVGDGALDDHAGGVNPLWHCCSPAAAP